MLNFVSSVILKHFIFHTQCKLVICKSALSYSLLRFFICIDVKRTIGLTPNGCIYKYWLYMFVFYAK